jgi:glycosyltransferase involved in cell wall biosynthesis
MRILYLMYTQRNSLTESESLNIGLPWVQTLLGELAKHESLTIGLALPFNNNVIQNIQKDGISIFGLPNPVNKNIFSKMYRRITCTFSKTKIITSLLKVISDFNPDLIQIFGSENFLGLIIKLQSKPVILHIQGYASVCAAKWFTGFSKWEQVRYAGLKDLILFRSSFREFLCFRKKVVTEEVILRNCKYFMGRTNFDRRISALVAPGSKYFQCEEIIRNEFSENHWNFKLQKEIRCISILRGTTYKGIDLLIKALLILKRYSDLSCNIKICGVSDDERIVKMIKKKFKKELIPGDVEYLGKLTAYELVKQLCSSNFYIHPSYVENSPNSICEAMVLGMPIIAVNAGGISSLIKDDVEGILIQEGEPYSLAGAIVSLTKDYEKAKLLGYNARIRALKKHNPKDIISNLLDVYNTIISENQEKTLIEECQINC